MSTLAKPRQQVNRLGRHDITSRQERVRGVLPRGINAEKMCLLDYRLLGGTGAGLFACLCWFTVCKLKIIALSTHSVITVSLEVLCQIALLL